MKCSMKIKCARNKSAKVGEAQREREGLREREREGQASKAVRAAKQSCVPGKAKDLRKATTLHKSLLPLAAAAFVIENVAYMEMPWQNIFLHPAAACHCFVSAFPFSSAYTCFFFLLYLFY